MEKTSPVIFVDYRETTERKNKVNERVANLLKSMGCILKETNLPYGDFVTSTDTVVELKASIADMLSSLTDGRLFAQAHGMKENYPHAYEIIVGILSFDFKNNKSYSYRTMYKEGKKIYIKKDLHRHPDSILGAIVALSQMGVNILWASNIVQAAKYIYLLAKRAQIDEKKEVRLQVIKKTGLTPNQEKQLIIESIPGIGPVQSKSLLRHFKTIRSIFNASEEELQKVPNIGEVKAKKIISIATEEYQEEDSEKSNTAQ